MGLNLNPFGTNRRKNVVARMNAKLKKNPLIEDVPEKINSEDDFFNYLKAMGYEIKNVHTEYSGEDIGDIVEISKILSVYFKNPKALMEKINDLI